MLKVLSNAFAIIASLVTFFVCVMLASVTRGWEVPSLMLMGVLHFANLVYIAGWRKWK